MADNDIVTGSTFADLPDVRMNANGEQYVAVPPAPEPTVPDQAAQPAPQMIPVPVPVPAAQESDADFLRKLTLARQADEEAKASARQQEFWKRVGTPPALPDDDDELADPKKVREVIKRTQDWAKDLVAENARVLGSTIQELNQEAQASRINRAEMAADRARYALIQQGIQDVDAYWQPVEEMLRRNPQTYWQIRTNPQAMESAVKIVRDHMVRSGQAIPMQPPAPPVSAPYGNANPPAAAAQIPQGLDPSMSRVAKTLGIQWKPEDFARRRIVR